MESKDKMDFNNHNGGGDQQDSPAPHDVASLREKFTEQQQLISMMQIQLDLQNEKLAKHDQLIQNLTARLQKLEGGKEEKSEEKASTSAAEPSVQKSDWTTTSGTVSVAEMVKQAAEETITSQSITNYVFDENSGLYFDTVSGFYYDPVQELFYNGHTKTYYKYDAATQTYDVHSQVVEKSSKRKKKPKVKSKEDKKTTATVSSNPSSPASENLLDPDSNKKLSDVEEGELSDSTIGSKDEGDSDSVSDSDTITSHTTTDSELREMSIPCIRAVIVESSLSSLPKGFLFIVTCMGGSIGCEGSMHSILIPESSVSEHHAEFTFNSEEGKYYLTDLGSESGTFLNGKRLSESKIKSELHEILHGSSLKVGETTLLLHVHSGSLTCGHCEPGLTITKEPLYGLPLSKKKKEQIRKQELKKMKQKYGVEKTATESLSKLPDSYKDRASERRVLKGSDNPYEKTQVASINESIQEDNKGFKMMAKMGWKAGTALGTNSTTPGIVEPIKIELRTSRSGIGNPLEENPLAKSSSKVKVKGSNGKKLDQAKIKEKTLKRFKESHENGTPTSTMDSFQE